MVKLLDRVKMTVSGTPGTGNITLSAAEAGFQTFAQAGGVDGNVVRYAVTDGTGFEIGTAVLSSSATVLTRTVQQSSNSNNALDLTSSAIVFATLSAADLAGNAAPIWTTTPPSTLSLAIDGSTAVTLAGVAIDEFPVKYSWDGYSGTTLFSDANLPPQLASAPTFVGGTASLVGSSTQSNAGSFNFRMKASDGVKTATAITSVSLSFSQPVTSGLLGVYDAANSTSYSGSGTTWSDYSGNSGPNLTLLSSTTYNSSGIGGKPSFSFSALNSIKTTSSLGSSATIVIIVQINAPSSLPRLVFLSEGGSNTDPFGFSTYDGDSSTALVSQAQYRLSSNDSSTANTLTIDKVDRSSATRGDVADLLYANTGTSAQMHSIVLHTADLSAGFSLQSRVVGGGGGEVTQGQIRALAFYNRDLTTSEITEIHNFYKSGYPSNSHMPA